MRKLRDISEYNGELDVAYLQRKIACAGEMQTAIKRFLDLELDLRMDNVVLYQKRKNELRKAMENYLNCEP